MLGSLAQGKGPNKLRSRALKTWDMVWDLRRLRAELGQAEEDEGCDSEMETIGGLNPGGKGRS